VVGVDGRGRSSRALAAAVDLARRLGEAELFVVYVRCARVCLPPGVGEALLVEELDDEEAEVRAEVQAVLGRTGLRWRFVSRQGEPSIELTSIAEQVDALMVVAGRRRLSVLRDLVLGSTSRQLVKRSRRPLLLVP